MGAQGAATIEAGPEASAPPSDRLHALDAVRAFALLMGVVLHASAAFLQDFPMPLWLGGGPPSVGAAVIYYVTHMFRMSAFFLIAGFFARLVVERRGVAGFVRDRAQRIAAPLVIFWFVFILLSAAAFVLGALPHGVGYLQSLVAPAQPGAGAERASAAGGGGISLQHLWFLYYLLIFYVLALAARAAWRGLDRRGVAAAGLDRIVAFLFGGLYGPLLIAAPIAVYFWLDKDWTAWLGLPAPFLLTPNTLALVGYGIPFVLGWLLHRQIPTLLGLRRFWLPSLLAAIALTVICLVLIGTTPQWSGSSLQGGQRLAYAAAYAAGTWFWVFAIVGTALRFLSRPSPATRYLADASYWIYLLHMVPLVFFITLLRPLPWPWEVKLAIMLGGSMPLLLLSYHYLVRFTFIGWLLNGRRQRRAAAAPPVARAPVPG
jgi:peptidoglycan/LPS O-acetylase OafA/YrhL